MARAYDDYRRRGATIAGVVIDPPEQNAAMVEKLALPFPILSDPDGEGAIKPLAAWDEKGNMARPAIIVLVPDGREVYRYVGADFMDRPSDDEILEALDRQGLPAITLPAATTADGAPKPGPRAISLADLAVYMRGVRFAMTAMTNRARDPFDKSEAERTAKMAEQYVAAVGETRRVAGDGAERSGTPPG